MDLHRTVEKHREALERVLVMLVAMVQVTPCAGPNGGIVRKALARQLHRHMLRLLRPAESALRRLIIVAARWLKVATPRWPDDVPRAWPLHRFDASESHCGEPASLWRQAPPHEARAPRVPFFPLFDPVKRLKARSPLPRSSVIEPRIRLMDALWWRRPQPPLRVPPQKSPDDLLDAAGLNRRLDLLVAALNDLPRQADRFARWQARRDALLAREQEQTVASGATSVGADDPGSRQTGTESDHPDGGGLPESAASTPPAKLRFQRKAPRPRHSSAWRRMSWHDAQHRVNDISGWAGRTTERLDTS